MRIFEDTYREWLKALKDEEQLPQKTNQLISILKLIHNEYPVATLHDCDESTQSNPVLLGSTALGTY
jgi:hypothetical protein